MRRRVLVVDDEDDIREVAQVSLEMLGGWKVFQADSGRRAIEVAKVEQLDVILLDVMMPDMDGPTTFRTLQTESRTQEIPVILLTAKVQTAEQRSLSQLGAAGLIAKPFDPMTLHQQVQRALGWDS